MRKSLAGQASMDDIRRRLNEYLFHEFAMALEADDSNISETWPFELREVGRASDLIVFEFQDDQPYFPLGSSERASRCS